MKAINNRYNKYRRSGISSKHAGQPTVVSPWRLRTYLWYPENSDFLKQIAKVNGCISGDKEDEYLLLEVSPVLLINENEVQVIPGAELFVHFSEGRCEVEATKE